MTATYAALLRGINVGGNKKVPMADLRAVLTGLGLGEVRTLLQSGNAVFTSEEDTDRLTAVIEAALADRFGFPVRVMVRSASELRAAADANPFPDPASDPAKYTVTFLSGRADPERLDAIDPASYAPDEYRLGDGGRELYGHFPNGLGRSKLSPLLDKRRLGVEATTRNWNTVTRLVEMTER